MSDDCQLVSDVGRRRLRSSDVSTCVVPRTHTGFGDRAFQVAGPRLWNSLPASLRQSDTTVGQFKKLLKTHLFSWDCGALVTVAFTAPCTNISSTTTTTTTIYYVIKSLNIKSVKLVTLLAELWAPNFNSVRMSDTYWVCNDRGLKRYLEIGQTEFHVCVCTLKADIKSRYGHETWYILVMRAVAVLLGQ